MITLSFDVLKVDKSRLKDFKRRNGDAGKSLELVLIETPDSDFGDYIVKQSISKEDKAKGVELPILGNARIMGKDRGGRQAPAKTAADPEINYGGDEVPF